MPILHNSLVPATGKEDPVVRSLRFNGAISSSEAGNLHRTAGTPTDEGKWTMSMWVKVGQQPTNGYMTLFGAGASNDNAASVSIYNGMLYADQATSSNHRTIRCSGRLLRDPAAWYHLCFAYDNSQSGSSGNNQNAYKWYVNGVRLTEPTYSHNESVTGYTHRFNSSGYIQRIGKYAHRSYNSTYKYHWDGLIANVHFVDGQQLEPTDFIEANDYGGYIPKEYTGSYGNNGFHIDAQPNNVDGELLISSISRNDGDQTFHDSAKGHQVTDYGNAEHSIKVGNPHTGSDRAVYFNGSDDYLTVPSSADFDFGSNNCTFEGWFLFEGFNENPDGIFSRNSTGSQGWSVCTDSTGQLEFFESTNNTYHESGFTFKTGVWYHIALSRKGNTYRVYVDGNEKVEAFLSSTPDQSVPLTIGAFYDNYAGYRLKGYCYDFRVSNGGDSYYPVDLTLPTETPSVESDTILQLDYKASGNTTATTSGSSTPSWTVNGSVHHSVGAGTPFSGDDRAMFFDGSGDYLSVPSHADLTPGTGDFTVEAWINYRGIPNSSNGSVIYAICGNGTSSSNACFMLKPNGHLGWYTGDSHYTGSSATAMSTNTWYHVAAVRSSGTVKLYIDGVEDYSATHSGNLNDTSDNRVGARTGTLLEFNGYMYDLRFSDAAKYTSSFTPPTSKLTAESDTQLLIQPDKGDTNFNDESSTGHTITATGSPTRTASTPFEDADKATSLYFDGSNDDITTGTDFIMGRAADHTFETWFYTTKNDSQYLYCHNYSQHYEGVSIRPNASSSQTVIGLGGNNNNWSPVLGSEATISLNTWHHLAIVILNGQVHFYLDGVLKHVDTTHSAWTGNPSNTTIGSQRYVNGNWRYHFQGYLRDMRISDTAKYRGNFTPPSSNLQSDSNTKLLIQPNNTDTAIGDETSNHTITGYGDNTDGSSSSFVTPVASTPYGAAAKSTAMYFDGSGDYIKVWDGSSGDYDFGTADYTIECWVNISSSSPSNYNTIFSNSHLGLHLFERGGEFYYYTSSDGGSNPSNGLTGYTTNTWYHVAAVRDGTDTRVYINGKCSLNYTWNGTTDASTSNFRIGGGDNYYLDGYIYDFRVTGGEAKYSGTSTASDWANFNEITAPFELNPVYLGADQSGNNNHFDATNVSLTHDVMLDNPFKNHPTWNPLVNSSTTFSEGNLKVTNTSSTPAKIVSTIGASSGKWYAEVLHAGQNNCPLGITADNQERNYLGDSDGNTSISFWCGTTATSVYINGSSVTFSGSGTTWASGDIIGIALNADDKEVSLYKNGSLVGAAVSYSSYNWTEAFFAAGNYISGLVYHANFGADPTFAGGYTGTPASSEWAYSPPNDSSGNPFKSLNTSNLDAPAVKPAENFEIAQWVGNETAGKVISPDISPDLVWIKNRDVAKNHTVGDSVRGANKALFTNNTNTESTLTTNITAFDTDASGGYSFTLGASEKVNDSTKNHVGWVWKAHQSPSGGSSSTTTYTVKVEDNSGDAWDYGGSYYDYSTYLPSVYMEIFENRNSSLVSLGKVAVQSYDSSGNSNSDLSEQTYTLECADLNAIAVKWHYDTSGDGQEWDYPNYYNDYLNDQKITILDGTSSTSGTWLGVTGQSGTDNYSNDDGTSSNYSPPTGWADGDTLKAATTSYNGSDTATLTSGSGSSGPTEKYNAAAGLTIISYSGGGYTDGDTQTLDHSLGVPLEFVMAKARTSNDGQDNGDWIVWHKDLSSGEYLFLNQNYSKRTEVSGYDLIATATSGTQHQVVVNNGTDDSSYNYHYLNSGPDVGTGEDYILYGWAGVEGYSKFGTYRGAGNNGVFVYTGHRPKMVWIKNIDTTGNWFIFDAARDTHNETVNYLQANSSNQETTNSGYKIDILSNGFKINVESTHMNNSAYDYVFCSWAEQPFAAPSNAR